LQKQCCDLYSQHNLPSFYIPYLKTFGRQYQSQKERSKAGAMATLQQSPKEVLETIALLLGQTPGDFLWFGSVCRSFNNAVAQDSSVWKDLAVIKFGSLIATKSIALYDNWKMLMMDDNKRGALPTISEQKVCNFIFNRPIYYFCCIVECVMWDRDACEIQVHIDVRGEYDLRHPLTSSLALRSFDIMFQPNRFVANPISSPKHHKGYLVFAAPNIPGQYSFCYGNPVQQNHPIFEVTTDYEAVVLFSIPPDGGGLLQAFAAVTKPQVGCKYTFREESPFADDTPEKSRARFAAIVPEEVMNRQIPYVWFVEEECDNANDDDITETDGNGIDT
jgi:hypothetical protein